MTTTATRFFRHFTVPTLRLVAGSLLLLAPIPAVAQESFGEIPFKYQEYVLFSGSLEGKHGNFIFDTSIDGLCLDSAFFKESGLAARLHGDRSASATDNGRPAGNEVTGDLSFHAGDLSHTFSSAPLFPLRNIVGEEADGILGLGPLAGKIFALDFEKSQLRLYSSLPHLDFSRFRGIDLRQNDGRLYVSVSVITPNGVNVRGSFLIDLGFTGNVFLTSATTRRYALGEQVKEKTHFTSKDIGIGRATDTYEFRSESVRIGEYAIVGMSARYSTDDDAFPNEENCCGILGNAFFKRFETFFDLQQNRLYLRPLPGAFDSDPENTLGFSFINYAKTSGWWIVSNLICGGSAEEAGLKLDDRIVRVNGKRVSRFGHDDRRELLRTDKPTKLTYLRGNTRREAILKPKYSDNLR